MCSYVSQCQTRRSWLNLLRWGSNYHQMGVHVIPLVIWGHLEQTDLWLTTHVYMDELSVWACRGVSQWVMTVTMFTSNVRLKYPPWESGEELICQSISHVLGRKEACLGADQVEVDGKLAMLARLELLHKLDARFITCQCSLMWSRMCWFSICLQSSRQKNDVIDDKLHVWQTN